ncbi:hypothetical protein DVB88_00310 [Tsukamurella pulmonis]|nr:hypothetical protein DVB88_00310 [Tsukamurella pulmonis]
MSRRRTTRSLSRRSWLALVLVTATAVFVAIGAYRDRSGAEPGAGPAAPSATPSDGAPLDGVRIVAARERAPQPYRRAAFGKAWTDDQSAPLGHNGCDTRIICSDIRQPSRFSLFNVPDGAQRLGIRLRGTCGTRSFP